MELPAEEPVIKAMKIAVTAKKNDWHGNIEAPLVDGVRHTTITATRNDEALEVLYVGNAYQEGTYTLFDRRFNLHCASVALEKVRAWPDILELFKMFPKLNRPTLCDKYVRLPFKLDDPANDIMEKTFGRKMFWYSHVNSRMETDVVMEPRGGLPVTPKKGLNAYRIADVGHRRIYHFIGQQAGFRSVLLDMLIKVG